MRHDIPADLASGDRPAEKEPLDLVAIDRFQEGRLLAGLDALDRHSDTQLMSLDAIRFLIDRMEHA